LASAIATAAHAIARTASSIRSRQPELARGPALVAIRSRGGEPHHARAAPADQVDRDRHRERGDTDQHERRQGIPSTTELCTSAASKHQRGGRPAGSGNHGRGLARCRGVLCLADGDDGVHWSSAHEFLGAAGDFLAAREAEHCLLLGLASTIADHPEVYREPRFWTVHDGERVAAAALRTRRTTWSCRCLDEPRWLAALAGGRARERRAARRDRPDRRGARARRGLVRTHRPAPRCARRRSGFRLDRVIPPAPAPAATAGRGTRSRAARAWMAAFAAEAAPRRPAGRHRGRSPIASSAARPRRHLWEDSGEVVAFAGVSGPTPRGIRIGRSTRRGPPRPRLREPPGRRRDPAPARLGPAALLPVHGSGESDLESHLPGRSAMRRWSMSISTDFRRSPILGGVAPSDRVTSSRTCRELCQSGQRECGCDAISHGQRVVAGTTCGNWLQRSR